MGFFSGIFDTVKDVVGSVADVVKPLAPLASFIPGVGPMLGTAINAGTQYASRLNDNPDDAVPYVNYAEGPEYGDNSGTIDFGARASRTTDDWTRFLPSADTAWSAASRLASSGIAGYMGYQGQNSANTENIRQAQLQRDFASEQSQRAMDFSERMANTQWQRGVADMKAAGLSPMLAYSKGGAASPGGVTSSGVAAQVQNAMTPAMSSALSVAQGMATVENIRADTRVKNVQAQLEAARISETGARTVDLGSAADLKAQQREEIILQMNKVQPEINRILAETDLTRDRQKEVGQHIQLMLRQGNFAEVQRAAHELKLPELVNLARAQQSWWMQNISPYLNDAGKVAASAGALGSMLRYLPRGFEEISQHDWSSGGRRGSETTTRRGTR